MGLIKPVQRRGKNIVIGLGLEERYGSSHGRGKRGTFSAVSIAIYWCIFLVVTVLPLEICQSTRMNVSVIFRAVAETRRVTLRPKKLKKPMENAMATDEPTRARGLESVWCHPRGRSKNGERAAIDGKGIGSTVKSRIEGPLKKPSHPTATTGATEYVDMIFSSMTNCVVHGQPWYYIHGAHLQESSLRGHESFRLQNRIRTSWTSNLAA